MNVVRVTNKAWLPGKLPIDGIIRTALSNSGQAIVVPDLGWENGLRDENDWHAVAVSLGIETLLGGHAG